MKKYKALRPFYLGKIEGKDIEVIQNEIIELPETVGKTMVGNGWMVEAKEEPKAEEETTKAEEKPEVEAKEEPKAKK